MLKALVTQLHERLHALVRHNSVQEAAILTLPDEARELNNRNMRILSDAHPDLVQMLQILDAHGEFSHSIHYYLEMTQKASGNVLKNI